MTRHASCRALIWRVASQPSTIGMTIKVFTVLSGSMAFVLSCCAFTIRPNQAGRIGQQADLNGGGASISSSFRRLSGQAGTTTGDVGLQAEKGGLQEYLLVCKL